MTNERQDELDKKDSNEVPSGFHPVYMVELLFREEPVVNRVQLQDALSRYTGKVRLAVKQINEQQPSQKKMDEAGTHSEEGNASAYKQEMLVFYHLDHQVSFEEGAIPAQTCMLPVHGIKDRSRFGGAVQQAWHWPEAGQAVKSARYSIRLHDMFSAAMPRKQRLELFQNMLQAVMEVLPCEGMYWYGSDKLVEPEAYIQSQKREEHLYAAMNVRMYQAGGTEEQRELVMDTVGLSALGVPDVQCHFTGLDPDTVAQTLLGAAYYIFDQGDVLQDGQTLGSSGGRRWRCEHQAALIAPGRYVIDLNPGDAHAAQPLDSSRHI
ncbi:DUF4261 domain-containing protein [Paenibacillus xylanilyticus]|uniref:DUF4261 domain-containing protein n=1 Tax=Paenibacillus xylanilyticus TaxID=248903 RepID=A0A7Y6C4R7_9BACL|nr:DUF4261 domain-containing protein [Paenibacillus xylanilyticus]NUU80191.1 DUF4261 domain-containing protein [Paenibacillus xylanilyticus]